MLRDSIKYFVGRNLAEVNKIWPIHKAIPILLTFGAIGIIVMFASHYYRERKISKSFFQTELHCRLGKSVSTANYRFYKVENEWYGVQGLINLKINPGDSLSKSKNSFDIYVHHRNGFVDEYNYPTTFIKSIEDDAKLKRHFILEADTLKADFNGND